MTLQWAVLMILIIATGMYAEEQHQTQLASDYATLDSLTRNMWVYRSAAMQYARSNPSFSGTPDDRLLNLPEWFTKSVGVSSYLAAGKAYTYFNGVAPSGLPSSLVDLTKSTSIGVKRSGVLISPMIGITNVVIPPAIPEGATVIVN
ncbi:type IV pilus biogenesis protein PilM [Pseudomonas sp. CCM 7893]|uniref:Type IV pilus biogenesis protein PilM n=1 Tax=Pseudomonas spelaei TaxID=1055469 RepID=A0A6I3WJN6_9PSED|nr:type IV pilus biogenesis protein PilM [Pseudomonas spelaei]MUF07954.1 type IV pilus biogenesis protein PilM [Pseudomonas spelaei]